MGLFRRSFEVEQKDYITRQQYPEDHHLKYTCHKKMNTRPGSLKGEGVFIGALAKFQKATISLVLSICPSLRLSLWNNSAPNGRIFMKFDI
jgi:hypothetical protein